MNLKIVWHNLTSQIKMGTKYTTDLVNGERDRVKTKCAWTFFSNPFGFALCLMVNNKIGATKSGDVIENMLKWYSSCNVMPAIRFNRMNIKSKIQSKYIWYRIDLENNLNK